MFLKKLCFLWLGVGMASNLQCSQNWVEFVTFSSRMLVTVSVHSQALAIEGSWNMYEMTSWDGSLLLSWTVSGRLRLLSLASLSSLSPPHLHLLLTFACVRQGLSPNLSLNSGSSWRAVPNCWDCWCHFYFVLFCLHFLTREGGNVLICL